MFASSTDVASLMELLSQAFYTTIDWLISNHSPKKFQKIIITKRNLQNNSAPSSINNMPKDSVELLAVTNEDKLTFEKQINTFCRSGSCQLNTIF